MDEMSDEQPSATTAELDLVREAVRSFLRRRAPLNAVLAGMESSPGHDEAVWATFRDELGVTGLLMPAHAGGAGLGVAGAASVLEEAGATVYPGPVLPCVVAGLSLLTLGGDALPRDMLSSFATGGMTFEFAAGSRRHLLDVMSQDITAQKVGGAWRLDGQARLALDAGSPDRLVVLAATPGGARMFDVDVRTAGVRRSPIPPMDQTRRLIRLELTGAEAACLTEAPIAPDALQEFVALCCIAVAAEQIGAARAALAATVEYSKERFQFGRAIGSFQAIKHRLSDVHVQVECAGMAYADAVAAASGAVSLRLRAHRAIALTTDAFLAAARTMVQVHGGVGFTWEHPAHLFVKRAKSSQLLFGGAYAHRQVVASELSFAAGRPA